MPSVTWVKGATTITFPLGCTRGPLTPQQSRVVKGKLANGALVTYDLGFTPAKAMVYEFPHVTRALLDTVISFKNSTVKDDALNFTLTDNSESPAFVKTVRLVDYAEIPEQYTDPAAPRFSLRVTLQEEPS